IRRDADVVVVGAQSVRAEGYVIPSGARLAIVTSSGDLDGHGLTLSPGAAADQVLIVCPASRVAMVTDRAQQPGVQVIGVAGSDRMTPHGILGALSELGHRRVVCEGGPSLASQFVAAGVIDEFCVTVAPVIEPAQHPFVTVTAQTRPDTDVDGLLVDGAGVSYLRLRVRA
ncbi:MAG: dihydrofolate reductase family protein, partial [Actinobacteria bacterium]|nr:dihydrofolate reductase family protein [Actinomycetota bacterium]